MTDVAWVVALASSSQPQSAVTVAVVVLVTVTITSPGLVLVVETVWLLVVDVVIEFVEGGRETLRVVVKADEASTSLLLDPLEGGLE